MNKREVDLLNLVEHDSEFRQKLLSILKDTNLQEKVQAHPPVTRVKTPCNPSPLPDNFRELNPGTYMWMQYWMKHPEEQESMLTQKKRR